METLAKLLIKILPDALLEFIRAHQQAELDRMKAEAAADEERELRRKEIDP